MSSGSSDAAITLGQALPIVRIVDQLSRALSNPAAVHAHCAALVGVDSRVVESMLACFVEEGFLIVDEEGGYERALSVLRAKIFRAENRSEQVGSLRALFPVTWNGLCIETDMYCEMYHWFLDNRVVGMRRDEAVRQCVVETCLELALVTAVVDFCLLMDLL